MSKENLNWQSKLVLLLTIPLVGTGLVLQIHWWATQYASVGIWTIGISLLLALVVLKFQAATLAGAATGAAITASMMFSTVSFPYEPWHTALPAVLSVSVLAWAATRIGRARKEKLGTAERRHGRSASQIAANLGCAALACSELVQSWLINLPGHSLPNGSSALFLTLGLAALAEAAADTVSSELGQVIGGQPRMITTFKIAAPGTDGAVSVAGTLAGIAAAVIVAAIGTVALRGNATMFWISSAGAVFGLLFDSILGATLEQRRWLNNDAVNFLSTCSAALSALAMAFLLLHF